MMKIFIPFLLFSFAAQAQDNTGNNLYNNFRQPPPAALPWVFWYWMQASVSKGGITADLEAMKSAGIGGAYLMSIKGPASPPLMQPVQQLSPEWWEMVVFAMKEADRLGIKIGMHVSDGFALAGGPWITPEKSMQKVVYSMTTLEGGRVFTGNLPRPESYKGYYRDIAVFAYPAREPLPAGAELPVVTSSKGADASFLADKENSKTFSSSDSCWIQYSFKKPFTCRSIVIRTNGNNYQAHRLMIQTSNDGIHFRNAGRLRPPRHGWQDTDADVTHSIVPVTAKYYRFIYDKSGSEPGSEDLDAAKWKSSFKIRGIELLTAPRINQYEGKSGLIWRISEPATKKEIPDSLCVPKDKIITLSTQMDTSGNISWKIPPGRWTIIRMGHTSTGHTNATGGAGAGLECDKFDPAAIRLQFDNWFAEAFRRAGPDLARRVLTMFHVDSWECGSQNWSPVFRSEFQRRRGYDLLPYLPVMAGIPIQSAGKSERVLHDVRQTIAELVNDQFYGTLAKLAHGKGCSFSAECVAPTMTSDGMLHYSKVDLPMGEFWHNSPTHDKPNDMLDAISGAHIYGKNIVQAESFTTLRMTWNEHPGSLKTLQDRNYALGINKMVYHVFAHNPWTDRKPGMTLDGVGLYFQRDQTWWKPGKAWVDYAARCQALLQMGRPVADLAVFTGEEIPRRAVLPDRLVTTLPGIFGKERVKQEAERLANKGEPLRTIPDGVTHSANMADPEDWTDPLRGYAYDSFNEDALLRLAKTEKGRIVLPGGAVYKALILPLPTGMTPSGNKYSPVVKKRISELAAAGLKIIRKVPYQDDSFDKLGIGRDVICKDSTGLQAKGIAWTHRTAPEFDIYFISNQISVVRIFELSLRVTGRQPELWDPVTGDTMQVKDWHVANGRTVLKIKLEQNGSAFIVFHKPAVVKRSKQGDNWLQFKILESINNNWNVKFDTAAGGPLAIQRFDILKDWTTIDSTRYYSGTAYYSNTVEYEPAGNNKRIWLQFDEVNNLAEVIINGINCGVVWTAPYRVDITKALRKGTNNIKVNVTNTWANRLIGDHSLPEGNKKTWTTAPFRLEGKPLNPSGLTGNIEIVESNN